MAARPATGGLLALPELLSAVRRRRGAAAARVSEDDVLRAITQLRSLGGGWAVVTVGGQQCVRSVPSELDGDASAALGAAAAAGGVLSAAAAAKALTWTQRRAEDALTALLKARRPPCDADVARWFRGSRAETHPSFFLSFLPL